MSPALRDAIMARLETVPEPCSIAMRAPVSIVGMGLIDALRLEDRRLTVTMCLTDPGCVHFRSMQAYIAGVLEGLPDIDSVEVVQVTDKLWTPERADQGVA